MNDLLFEPAPAVNSRNFHTIQHTSKNDPKTLVQSVNQSINESVLPSINHSTIDHSSVMPAHTKIKYHLGIIDHKARQSTEMGDSNRLFR